MCPAAPPADEDLASFCWGILSRRVPRAAKVFIHHTLCIVAECRDSRAFVCCGTTLVHASRLLTSPLLGVSRHQSPSSYVAGPVSAHHINRSVEVAGSNHSGKSSPCASRGDGPKCQSEDRVSIATSLGHGLARLVSGQRPTKTPLSLSFEMQAMSVRFIDGRRCFKTGRN